MRVIAGTFRGRRLAAPKGKHLVRPTADRVKESVFSILQEQIVDANFLDLCAGTGSMGIEALSRGAKHVTFLERDRRCLEIIERNLHTCGLLAESQGRYHLLRRDVMKGIAYLCKRSAIFEIIYFDPPYGVDLVGGSQLYTTCLPRVAEGSLLCVGGILLVEHARQVVLPDAIGSLRRSRQARYGDTVVSFYEKN